MLVNKKQVVERAVAIVVKLEDASSLDRESSGTPHQHSCLENPMDGGAWLAAVHGVARSQT